LSITHLDTASTPVTLSLLAAFLALIVLVVAFLVHRRRHPNSESFGSPYVQQVLSHGSLFASRCTQTRFAQPKSAPTQSPSGSCAGAGAFCAIQQQLSQGGSGRPQGFGKTTAIKSPSSGYIKKSPSPTDPKSPPRDNGKNGLQVAVDPNVRGKVDSNGKSITIDDVEKEVAATGRLLFKLKYSYERQSLFVFVTGCDELQSKNSIDPYVKLVLLPDKSQKVKTKVIRKATSPRFEEEFIFFKVPANHLNLLSLHFTVQSFDR
jgi:hypothetical protein